MTLLENYTKCLKKTQYRLFTNSSNKLKKTFSRRNISETHSMKHYFDTKTIQRHYRKQQMKIFMNTDVNIQQNTSKPNSAAFEKDHPRIKWNLFLK